MSLPTGFRIRLADDVLSAGDGSVLVGGSPLTAMRLSRAARQRVVERALTVDDDVAAFVADRLLAANLAFPVLDPTEAASAADLTVVIPVRDRSEQLGRALACLAGVRVVVVDDASIEPGLVGAVASAYGAKLVRLDHNVGPAAARNIGLASVATPYVAFVDSDVVVSAGTLLGLTAHFADPSVVLVAPHVRGRAVNATPRWFERYEQSSPALGLGERPGVVRPRAAVAWLPSACLVGRPEGLGSGFDSSMRVGEDVDFVWRLVARGDRVRYDPSFEAHHDTRPTLREWMGRKFVYGTGGAALAKRHPANVVTAVLSPSMALAGLALLVRRPWSVPVAVVGIASGAAALLTSLPNVPERPALAARLSIRGLGWTLRQETALALRHWWPPLVLAAVRSRTARRVLVSAILVDVISIRIEQPALKPVPTFAGRRLDDLAYGAGLWWGAIKCRSPRCLAVRLVGPLPRGTKKAT